MAGSKMLRNPSCVLSQPKAIDTKKVGLPTAQEIMDEFPAVFNGQVRVMEGEQFHITLVENAVPYRVKTP